MGLRLNQSHLIVGFLIIFAEASRAQLAPTDARSRATRIRKNTQANKPYATQEGSEVFKFPV